MTGFSDAEFTIVDIFGQGDKMVKHWNFKGTHDGDFFGVPATGKSVDISGTTIIIMKDGKLAYLDFGMMSRIESYQRYGFIEAVVHLVNRDFDALAASCLP